MLDTNGAVVATAVEDMVEGLLARLPYIVIGLLVLLVLFIGGRMAKWAIRQAGQRTRLDPLLADLLGGLTQVLLTILGLLVAAVVVFPTFRPGDLLAGLGITSVAAGFAFKDVLQNWLSGVFILWRRPFQIGDQIRSRNHEGTVEEITVRSTVIRTYDGERALIPSSEVYTNAVLVRTAYGHRRVRFSVGVGYRDSIEHARRTLIECLARTEGVLGEPAPLAHVVELAASSVRFELLFWTGAEQANVLAVSDRVATAIKLALDREGIDMPYPHTVVLMDSHWRPDKGLIPGEHPT